MLEVAKPDVSVFSLSICILTCNRDELLTPLLSELSRQISPGDEILVLDTGGNKSTRKVISALAIGEVQYHPFPMKQFDFATARNKLLGLARGHGVAFIDDDAFPFPNWVDQVRSNLSNWTASGGVTVADGEMPKWWDPEINWCIGLSPPGTALGKPGYYPDTCNMAAQRSLWQEHPFRSVSRGNRELYATGREDAEWWTDRRLNGENLGIRYLQAVAHHVHPDRLSWKYVKERAYNDGVSSWLRRPSYEAATAIPWDLAHIVGIVIDKFIIKPFDRRQRLADVVWFHRQWGKYVAVWRSPGQSRPRRFEQLLQLGKAGIFQVRIRIGRLLFHGVKLFYKSGGVAGAAPKIIFISADCHVGDSLLLRRHIQAVALTFPAAQVLVSSRYPVLLTGLAKNVYVLNTSEMSHYLGNAGLTVDVALVPYFPFGDIKLWRNSLSNVGVTYDCDVSFPGRRDYMYARKTVPKNLELHEHENLARLFRQWTLRGDVSVPPPEVPAADIEWRNRMLRDLQIDGNYILVQFGAGHDYKEWPLDCWIPFLQNFAKRVKLPILITGGENWAEAADIAAGQISHIPGIYNVIPETTLEQVMALIEGTSLLIAGCSGPKHIAMTFNIPTFTLYAATEPERWGTSYNHNIHGYVNAVKQKFTAMELQGLEKHHRIRLLDPETVASEAARHYFTLK